MRYFFSFLLSKNKQLLLSKVYFHKYVLIIMELSILFKGIPLNIDLYGFIIRVSI